MTFRIEAQRFRVFDHPGMTSIRPITLLTGGNSAGKTSFLAAIRYLADISNFGGAGATFNKEPFLLGSYDQIAHHRGGRYGRAPSFCLSYEGPVPENRLIGPIHSRRPIRRATFTLSFAKRLSQPAVSSLEVEAGSTEVGIRFSNEWKTIHAKVKLGDAMFETRADTNSILPIDAVGQDPVILTYVLESIFRQQPQSDLRPDELQRITQFAQVAATVRGVISAVPNASFVGAPVRSRPSRTYDPTDITPQAEGSHVPSQLAQLARNAPDEWERVRTTLTAFGRASSLFSDLEVRSLGSSQSDPFQLFVTINGPRRNIVDVGYGVSQSLPVLYELIRRPANSLYIMQQPEVHLHPEAQAALGTLVVEGVISKPGYLIIETHSDYLIDRVRRHIKEGKISADQVSLLYFERSGFTANISEIGLDSGGEISSAPDTYRDFFLKEQLENLGF